MHKLQSLNPLLARRNSRDNNSATIFFQLKGPDVVAQHFGAGIKRESSQTWPDAALRSRFRIRTNYQCVTYLPMITTQEARPNFGEAVAETRNSIRDEHARRSTSCRTTSREPKLGPTKYKRTVFSPVKIFLEGIRVFR